MRYRIRYVPRNFGKVPSNFKVPRNFGKVPIRYCIDIIYDIVCDIVCDIVFSLIK